MLLIQLKYPFTIWKTDDDIIVEKDYGTHRDKELAQRDSYVLGFFFYLPQMLKM